jgi:6-phosphofructo-2-kinase/fructose-2,6-biphosphatase 2
MFVVNVGAVDTFRPKGQGTRVLSNDLFISTNIGASGEISDTSNPILPISPIVITSKSLANEA